MSKKLINDPERVVDESLAGLVAVNSGLKLLEGHRVVVRADVQEVVNQGKVGLRNRSQRLLINVLQVHFFTSRLSNTDR